MKVAIIMGSSSDYPIAEKALAILDKFGVEYIVRVISAHRALDTLQECVADFEKNEIKCVIGLVKQPICQCYSRNDSLPVIGVPIKGSAFLGMDTFNCPNAKGVR